MVFLTAFFLFLAVGFTLKTITVIVNGPDLVNVGTYVSATCWAVFYILNHFV